MTRGPGHRKQKNWVKGYGVETLHGDYYYYGYYCHHHHHHHHYYLIRLRQFSFSSLIGK